jgi:hypothetical protein
MGGVDMYIHVFLTSALVGGEWPASRPGRFTPRERAPGTCCIGGWVGPRTGLDSVQKENSCPYQDSNSDPSVIQHVASHYPGSLCKMYTVLVGNPKLKGRDRVGRYVGVVWRILLKRVWNKYRVSVWTLFSWCRIRPREHGNESSGAIKCKVIQGCCSTLGFSRNVWHGICIYRITAVLWVVNTYVVHRLFHSLEHFREPHALKATKFSMYKAYEMLKRDPCTAFSTYI